MQHKGDSECIPHAGAPDELCGFEKLPYDAFAGKYVSLLADPPRAAQLRARRAPRRAGRGGAPRREPVPLRPRREHRHAPRGAGRRRRARLPGPRRRGQRPPRERAAAGPARRPRVQPGRPRGALGRGELRATRSSPRCAGARPTARAGRASRCASSAARPRPTTCAARSDFAARRLRRAACRWAASCRRRPPARAPRFAVWALRDPGTPSAPGHAAPAHPDREGLARGRRAARAGARRRRRARRTAPASTSPTCAPRGAGRRPALHACGATPTSTPHDARLLLRARPREPDLPLERARSASRRASTARDPATIPRGLRGLLPRRPPLDHAGARLDLADLVRARGEAVSGLGAAARRAGARRAARRGRSLRAPAGALPARARGARARAGDSRASSCRASRPGRARRADASGALPGRRRGAARAPRARASSSEQDLDCGPEGLLGAELGAAGLAETRTDLLLRVARAGSREQQALLRRPSVPPFACRARGRAPRARRLRAARRGAPARAASIICSSSRASSCSAAARGASRRRSRAFTARPQRDALPRRARRGLAARGARRDRHRGEPRGAGDGARPRRARSGLARRPWLLAAGFGLLHGMGFAGALRAIGLPEHALPLALFAFNARHRGRAARRRAAARRRRADRRRAPPPPPAGPPTPLGGLGAFLVLDRLASWLAP